jgi:hypothetical protein
MISINIPTSIYVNLLIITILIIIIFGGIFVFNPESSKFIRIGASWFIILIVINLVNIVITLRHYEKNKNKIGKKGPTGYKGLKGLRGEGLTCGSVCGGAGLNNDPIRTTNINEKNQEIKDENIEAIDRKCVFPFIYGYQKFNSCANDEDVPISVKAMNFYKNHDNRYTGKTKSWCATSLNQTTKNGNNVKTWGVCMNPGESESVSKNILSNKLQKQKKAEYLRKNTGILDLKAIMGNRSNLICPAGYEKIPGDLNFASGGKYINLCKKEGLGSIGLESIRSIDKSEKCQENGEELVQNFDVAKNMDIESADFIKDLVGSPPVYLCMKKTSKPGDNGFIKQLNVFPFFDQNGDLQQTCPITDERKVVVNGLNEGNSQEVDICYTLSDINAPLIDTAFVYGKNNKLYFFKGDNFYIFDESNKILTREIPNDMKTLSRRQKMKYSIKEGKTLSEFGKMKSTLNQNNLNILKGRGLDDSLRLNAVFTWGKDNKTYFFKDKFVYLSVNNKIAKGYPKFINQVFNGVPDNFDAVFTWGLDRKTYFFKGNFYYKYDDVNNLVERGYPKRISFRWGSNSPSRINAIWTSKFDKQTYAISGTNYYKVTSESMELIGNINDFELNEIVGSS